MKSSFNQHLAALAGYDILSLFTTLLIFGLPTISLRYRTDLLPWILPIGCTLITKCLITLSSLRYISHTFETYLILNNCILWSRFGFAHIGRVGSVFATLMVTIERFIAVVYPLKKIQANGKLLLLCFFGSVVYNIPRFLEYEMRPITLNEDLQQLTHLTNSSFSGSNITQVISPI